jgi:hypothetical protein
MAPLVSVVKGKNCGFLTQKLQDTKQPLVMVRVKVNFAIVRWIAPLRVRVVNGNLTQMTTVK